MKTTLFGPMAAASIAGSVCADTIRVAAAVEQAGAKVFLMIDFQQGNASVDSELRPTRLILFGSPKIGASALEEAQLTELYVPLRLLAYKDADGATWLAYQDPTDAAAEYGVSADNPALIRMQGALERIAAIGAGG